MNRKIRIALYPWNFSPAIIASIDKIARKNRCTICGSGYPDLFWGTMVTNLSGSFQKITRIKGSSSYNVEDLRYCLGDRQWSRTNAGGV